MYTYTPGHSRLISVGAYLPQDRITSSELMEQIDAVNRFGVPPNWLERLTGIKEKRVTSPGILPSDMAAAAAKEALEWARMLACEIDAIIYTGLVRDYSEPATANNVQAKLDASNAIVFDVSNACHGFMNGIHLMDALIATGQARCGLVVTGEQGKLFTEKAISAVKNCRNKQELIKFVAGLTLGDAGAAVIMGQKIDPDTGFMGFALQSQGQHAGFCTAGGPLNEGPLITDMPGIVAESLELMAPMYQELMSRRLQWKTEELSRYIIHQVGGTSFKLHSQRMGVPMDIMPKTIVNMGNIITATIPVNLYNVVTTEGIESGEKLYLSGAGSGISISQAGLIWDAA